MDKVNIVKGWLDFANKDISCAKHLLGMRPVPLEIICYHSEQAAEEAVKGFLIYHNVEPLQIILPKVTDTSKIRIVPSS